MDEAVSNRKKFIWNMLGGLSSSGLSLILSIAVNRMLGGTYGGIFAFAYANAQLMYTIGAFGALSAADGKYTKIRRLSVQYGAVCGLCG